MGTDVSTSWKLLDSGMIHAKVGDCHDLVSMVPDGSDYGNIPLMSRSRRIWVCPKCGSLFKTSVYRLALMRRFRGCLYCCRNMKVFNDATYSGWLALAGNKGKEYKDALKACSILDKLCDTLSMLSGYFRFYRTNKRVPIQKIDSMYRTAMQNGTDSETGILLACTKCGSKRKILVKDIIKHSDNWDWFRCESCGNTVGSDIGRHADYNGTDVSDDSGMIHIAVSVLMSVVIRSDVPLDYSVLSGVLSGGRSYDLTMRCNKCARRWSMPSSVMMSHAMSVALDMPMSTADPSEYAWKLCPRCSPASYSPAEKDCFPDCFPTAVYDGHDPSESDNDDAGSANADVSKCNSSSSNVRTTDVIVPSGRTFSVYSTNVTSDYEREMNRRLSSMTSFTVITNVHGVLPGNLELDAWIPSLGIAFEWDAGNSPSHSRSRRVVKDTLASREGIRVYHVRPSKRYQSQLVWHNIGLALRKAEKEFLNRMNKS